MQSLLASIQVQDKSVQNAQLTDSTGVRISGSTLASELLSQPFDIRVNDTVLLSVTLKSVTEEISPEKYQKVVAILRAEEKKANAIELPEYITKCEDIGVHKDMALSILKTLEQNDEVLHVENHIELSNKIILKPEIVLAAVENILKTPLLPATLVEKNLLLASLRKDFEAQTVIYMESRDKGEALAQRIAVTGFALLLVQAAVFGHFTWWDEAGWDIMEPITWFTGVVEFVIGGMAYYLYRGSEYSHLNMREGLVTWTANRHFRRRGFNPEKYEKLKRDIANLEREVKVLTLSHAAKE